jgi:hypothetical protein
MTRLRTDATNFVRYPNGTTHAVLELRTAEEERARSVEHVDLHTVEHRRQQTTTAVVRDVRARRPCPNRENTVFISFK